MPARAPRRALALPFVLLLAGSAGASGDVWEEIERLESAGDAAAALELLERSAESSPEADSLRAASLRQRLLHRLGRLEAARAAGARWIELAEVAADPVELATALWRTGRSFGAQHLDREAAALFERALAALGDRAPTLPTAEIRIDLASVESNLGRYLDAEAQLAAASRDPGLGRDARLAVKLETAWGTLLERGGDKLGALEHRERALERARAIDDPHLRAIAANNLAQSQITVHDYARALANLEEVLAVEPGARLRSIAEISSGICHYELNRLEEAEAALERGRRIARQNGDLAVEGWASGELGSVRLAQGDDEAALAAFDRAIAASRARGDLRNEAIWWTNRGRVFRDRERWREALEQYRRAEALERSVPGQTPSASLRKHLGQCHAGLGETEEAERLFLEALELARTAGDTKVVWETELERARLYARTGREDEARATYLAALAGIETIRGALQLEALETDFFENKVGAYLETIDFLVATGGAAGEALAFEVSERARARAFLGSLAEARARLEQTLPAELVERERRLLLDISQLQAAARRGEANAGASIELAARERELEQVRLRARAERPRFGEIRGLEPPRLAEVQSALEPGELLASYQLAEPVSHLWLIDRDRARHHALAPRSEIEAAVRGAYTTLIDAGSRPRLEALTRLLLAPLEVERVPRRALILVPSGILHYLPFEALPLGNGALADRFPTSYLPSASSLVELRRRPVEPAQPRCLALGAPQPTAVAGAGDALLGLGARSFGPLLFSRVEVERVRARFGATATRVLLGDDATEGRLKSEPLESYSVVHLATHGWIDASAPSRSGLVLAAGGDRDEDDGLLQFREILRLRLAAELVTLSACESALGELVTGEGMVGLARAFFYAGADTVVASLWSVSDEASAALMDVFYGGLAEGLPKAEALRRARLEIRERPGWEHPYYWAPFVLVGRGEAGVRVPPRRVPWLLAGGAAGLLALLAAAAVRRRARR